MFKFDPENEFEIFRLLDELRSLLGLHSRGQVVELAIRRLSAIVRFAQFANGMEPDGKQRRPDESLGILRSLVIDKGQQNDIDNDTKEMR